VGVVTEESEFGRDFVYGAHDGADRRRGSKVLELLEWQSHFKKLDAISTFR